MFGFLKKPQHNEPGTRVFDYYDGQAGLPMEPGYHRYTLTATDDPDKLRLDVYRRPTGDGQAVTQTAYLVSAKALEDAMFQVKKHRMATWNKRNCPGMCGRKMVCQFLWRGEPVQVSSDRMPTNGKGAFGDVQAAIAAYIDPALKIESPPKQI